MPATQLKSVLIVSQGHPPLGRYLADAFKSQGIAAAIFCTDQNTWFDKWIIHPVNKQLHNLRILPKSKSVWANHHWSHRNYLETEFQKALAWQQPDLILAVRGSTYCAHNIKNSTAIKFGWWIEPPNRVHEIQSELFDFDWYYSMSEESLAAFHTQGFNTCSYMPHMFSSEEFFPIEDAEKSLDLVFVGKWNPRRQCFIDAAMEVTDNILLYGKGWLKKNWTKPKYWRAWKGCLIQGQSLNKLYNRAKIVLNVTQWSPGANGGASGMNMRFFEVPATRSLFMTDHVDEADTIFKSNVDFIVFGDIADFKQQLRRVLSDVSYRTAVAEHGYQTIKQISASYKTMVDDIISRYAELRAAQL